MSTRTTLPVEKKPEGKPVAGLLLRRGGDVHVTTGVQGKVAVGLNPSCPTFSRILTLLLLCLSL
ncbi:hypothetical protein [Rahnella sp. AA]|uniref:hypothetical protein n=1 Tax=Rahnella sp. AA TaxID=2057180 RepID=UPI0012FED235|nr:hypothetical protein [Rahnella sp. AA]